MAIKAAKEKKPDLSEVESGDLVGLYFGEVGRIRLLDRDQEGELARIYRRGEEARERLFQQESLKPEERKRLDQEVHEGDRAKGQLIQANTRLVISIAKKYMGLGVPFMDLVQEGNIGLMKAIERFKPELGNKLSTYATWWIRQGLTRAVEAQGRTIRLPVHKQQEIRRLKRASSRIEQQLDREPTTQELAEALEMSQAKVEQLIAMSRRTLSLEKPVGDGGQSTLGQFIEDESTAEPFEVAATHLARESIDEALGSLTPRQERVLRLRYGLEDGETYGLRDIAERFDLTKERIRQIEKEALRRLRHPNCHRKLRGYLSQ